MSRPALEIADIFRRHGAAWRTVHAGHVGLGQLKVMSAIETCRTAALGGHVEACEGCRHTRVAYNSCRNRHCPKCQGAAAREWLAARAADLLPVGCFYVVLRAPPAPGRRPRTDGEPDEGVVTRHGQIQHRVEATPLRPSDTLAPTVSGTVRHEPGTAPSACRHPWRPSIPAPVARLDASPDHGFASAGWLRRPRALDAPAKSP